MQGRRAKNFTENEKSLLLHLVMKQRDIIENKQTDATTNYLKSEAWESMAREFNCNAVTEARSAKQLKELYHILKKKAKKNYNDDMIERNQTDQKCFIPKTTNVDHQVINIIMSECDLDQNSYDSNSCTYQPVSNQKSELQISSFSQIREDDDDQQDVKTPFVIQPSNDFDPLSHERINDFDNAKDDNGAEEESALLKRKLSILDIEQRIKEASLKKCLVELEMAENSRRHNLTIQKLEREKKEYLLEVVKLDYRIKNLRFRKQRLLKIRRVRHTS